MTLPPASHFRALQKPHAVAEKRYLSSVLRRRMIPTFRTEAPARVVEEVPAREVAEVPARGEVAVWAVLLVVHKEVHRAAKEGGDGHRQPLSHRPHRQIQ